MENDKLFSKQEEIKVIVMQVMDSTIEADIKSNEVTDKLFSKQGETKMPVKVIDLIIEAEKNLSEVAVEFN